ncbi:MAG: HAD family hydrolase [Luteolibacter sp.]
MRESCEGLILLDAAGTLIRTAEPVEEVYARVFGEFGWRADSSRLRAGFRETFAWMADPDFGNYDEGEAAERAWWREVVGKTAETAGISSEGPGFEECFETLFAFYARGDAWEPFPEVEEVLESLRRKGWKLALVSNFDGRLRNVLAELGLADRVDAVLTSSDVRARKPKPDLLRAAMALFPDVSRVVHVGDSEKLDGGAAEAAGVPVFLLNRPAVDLRMLEEGLISLF